MKHLAIFFTLFFSTQSFACLSEPVEVDFSLAKRSVEVSGEQVIFKSKQPVDFEKTQALSFSVVKEDKENKIFIYTLDHQVENRNFTFNAVMENKDVIKVNLHIPAQAKDVRGGCTDGSVSYQ
jgi:hypothetical protein